MSAGRAVKWLQSEYFRFSTKSQPSEAVVIWKGGARERADDVLLFHRNKRTSEQSGLCSDVVPVVGLEPTRYRYQRILSPSRLPIPSLRQRMNFSIHWHKNQHYFKSIFCILTADINHTENERRNSCDR